MDGVELAHRPAGRHNSLMNPYALLDHDYRTHPPGSSRFKPVRTRAGRVASGAAATFDRAALRLMETLFLSGEQVDTTRDLTDHIERWKRIYLVPSNEAREHFSPDCELDDVREVQRTELGDGVRLRLRFESPCATLDETLQEQYRSYEPNHVCDVVVWRHDDASRPTVVCLHAWCMGLLWFDERVFAAKALYDAGFHVVLPTLPFHGTRTPEGALFGGQMFPSPRLDHSNEAFRQAILEIRALRGWLADHGHQGPFGLMGISLGGYLSSLLASLWDDWAFVVPIIAPASFADILWYHGANRPMRERALSAGVGLEQLRELWFVHSPLRYQLALEKDRALIVAATGDAIVRPAQSRTLWRHWGEPELRWIVGSHLAQTRWVTGSRVASRGKLDFMAEILPFLERFR